MAYRVTGEGYSAFFREQEDGREADNDDNDDGYTCLLCNTSYEKDLQLAAELGKTLLERNKELETSLRQHQNIVEDQSLEIEYLRKQTAALREVNDSRLRIYEQLEVSIQELETNNHRLTTQSINDKKHITSLETQVEKLEHRCEELLREVEDYERNKQDGPKGVIETKSDEAQALRDQLSEVRTQNSRLQTKLIELQDTIDTVTQENIRLEEQVLSMQRKQEEMVVIDQVRQGEICRRCLRAQEEMSMTGDEDDASVIDSLMNDDSYQSLLIKESLGELAEPNNPYRLLVEKYEALLKVQQTQRTAGIIKPHTTESTKCLTLQEELQMSGEFSCFHREEDDGEFETVIQATKPQSTPDFSEAETSSSGFSDEAINKSTQTEAHIPPGSFLCSITDGDDCKFSIYDEASPIETRFRKTPEYRRLFREIFDVLKRAAEAKDEGENLPLLEDLTPMCEIAPKVPPATPSVEDVPQVAEVKPETPMKRDILEQLSQGVSTSKKHRSRRQKRSYDLPPPSVGVGVVVSTGKGVRRRRENRQRSSDSGRSTPDCTNRPRPLNPWISEGVAQSSAIHEVAKLKQLDKSYAEVLRQGRQKSQQKMNN
ncbi:cerebellar degeneration-related protein 2 isoform X2 [Cimex lectularius]|uniref:Cerebellar degeneration-related protein 2-like n=1 Tax=Cimex lectularius TaxID=79782 RepID=A0A8I6S208_CIMLE|nr:cerebellar degeneration-related protein 2 isoform X2 [Cimex lectularius]